MNAGLCQKGLLLCSAHAGAPSDSACRRVVELGVGGVAGPELRLRLAVVVPERQLDGARHHALPQARQQRGACLR